MKKLILIAAATIGLSLLTGACTPAQIEWFKNDATPAQQQAVIAAIQQQNKPKPAGDCFAATRKHFPQSQWNKAYSIIKRESGGNPRAKNPRSSASGCFQILAGSWRHPSVSFSQGRFNPDANAKAARVLWNNGGWYCTCTWALTA